MGFWGDMGKELGKAVAQGAAEGLKKGLQDYQQQKRISAENERAVRQAADNGDLDAIGEMAATYFLKNDYSNAAYWARKGESRNDVTCLYLLGEIAIHRENYADAENYFMRNIDVNNDPDSAAELGFLYLNPANNPNLGKDVETAAKLFSFGLAQDNSHANSAYGLGLCMLETDDVNNIDMDFLKQLMQIAAKSENPAISKDALAVLQSIRENSNPPAKDGDCFITTAVCGSLNKPDDCFELTTFRNFRDGWLKNQSDGKNLIAEYYSIAPKIVDAINKAVDAKEIYKNIWLNYLRPCLEFIKNGDNFSCKEKYIEMVRELQKKYR